MIDQSQLQGHTFMENQVYIRCAECTQVDSTTKWAQRYRCTKCCNEIIVQGSSGQDIRTHSRHSDSNTGRSSVYQSKCIFNGHGNVKEFSSKVTPTSRRGPTTTTTTSCFSNGRATKKALVCGVCYKNQKYKLRGTISDAYKMRNFLIDRWGFSCQYGIRLLTDEEGASRTQLPTKKNMEEGMRWLVDGCKAGDSLVFYFSGHGISQLEVLYRDEVDGMDELLCPVDFDTAGTIRDNDLNSILVRPLPPGVTLHAIVDACHSGTILDLPWFFDCKQKEWVDNKPLSGANKGTSGGRAISFSACRDDQMAADTSAFSSSGMNGALTMSFIQALENNNLNMSYHELLIAMQEAIARSRGCKIRIILDKFFRRYFVQVPLLSCSDKMLDVDRTKFSL